MDWSKCPYCESEKIEAGDYADEGSDIAVEVSCPDCGEMWYEIYDQSHREGINGMELP
jgi:hypothetical protein